MIQNSEKIVHMLPDIIYKLDDNGCFTYVNNSVRNLGYEPSDLISKHFSQLIHPEDIGGVRRDEVLRLSAGKTPPEENQPKLFDERRTGKRITRDLQVRLIPKNFNVVSDRCADITASCRVIAVGSYAVNAGGIDREFTGTLGIIRDVMNVKKSEETLARCIDYYHSLVELSNDIFFVVATDGTVMFSSPSLRRILGYVPQELAGENIIDYLPGEDYKAVVSAFRKTRPEEPLFCVQCEIIHRDGSPLTFETKGRTVFDDLGRAMYLTIITHDVTMRVETEEKLRSAHSELEERVAERTAQLERANELLRVEIENRNRQDAIIIDSERKYRTLVNSIDDIVLNIDPEGVILFVNQAIQKIAGHDHRDVIGCSLLEFIHGDDMSGFLSLLLNAGGDGPVDPRALVGMICAGSEFRMVKKDGSCIWVELRCNPMKDNDGAVIGFRGIAHDITRRKMTEEEMLRESKIESLGILAAGIAHDYNNLLTAIIGNISLAKITLPRDDPNYTILTDAENASAMAKNLTQQLMAFSKGGSPVRKNTSIRNLLVDTAYFVLRGSQVRIVFDVDDLLWDAVIDRGQIGQVVNNIILNARQSMPEGGMIRIGAENAVIGDNAMVPLKKGNYIRISIEDQGQGIPDDVLPRIFDPYFSTKETGTGLGLAISYTIVKKHEGVITVASHRGVGTVFAIYLPASLRREGEPFSEEPKKVSASGRILLMDDEMIILDLGLKALRHLGYEVVTAANGSEAVRLFREAVQAGNPFSAVILDLIIPGGAGADRVIADLKAIDPVIKAVVTSGYADDPVMVDYDKHGFSGVLVKPFGLDDIEQELARVLAQ
ncbi:MAG: PAS domain S-box protein [Spirochaetes bacterium]|nr:PAS domain S-box protein [Spirochaetota bacterium]